MQPNYWPELHLDDWSDAQATLHRMTQIVGKTRLALSPFENHWWHCALYVTVRGMGTSPIMIWCRSRSAGPPPSPFSPRSEPPRAASQFS